ncbi:hypothetical protein H8D91_02205 [archaeon]|nr:hypothetical protein [archaeon]
MMDPEIRAKRNLLDLAKEEFLKRCEMAPDVDLEKSLKLSGFKLNKVFANVPFPERYEMLVEEYEQQINKNETEDYALIPAWWLPSIMEGIVEKEFLPFACYIKK